MRWVMVCCFKQKAAYDLRSSDWSSDACSSDLVLAKSRSQAPRPTWSRSPGTMPAGSAKARFRNSSSTPSRDTLPRAEYATSAAHGQTRPTSRSQAPISSRRKSEEHTSELQSLMRNSYSVFCFKKNKAHNHTLDKQYYKQ